MNVAAAIRQATQRLAATSETARLDAELLMAHCLGVSRSDMLVRSMADDAPQGFGPLVERRARHEPVAYVTQKAQFYGLDLVVAPGVLIPRADSETLIEAAIEEFDQRAPPRDILDLGTGSGALLLAALSIFPEAVGTAMDASAGAMAVFTQNVERHGGGRTINFSLASWHDAGWAKALGQHDLILCNPPYVEEDAELSEDIRKYEPASALFAGKDGLDDYRVLIPQLGKLLTPGGVAILEIGAAQAVSVTELAEKEGFVVKLRHDLANRPRALIVS